LCWAHVRRDFLKAARRWPDLERWMFVWVEDMRALYRLNAARLEAWDAPLRLEQQPAAFVARHRHPGTPPTQMQAHCGAHLQEPDLHIVKHKVLSRLHNHWVSVAWYSRTVSRLQPPGVGANLPSSPLA